MSFYLVISLCFVLFLSIIFSFIFSGGETSLIVSNTAKLNKLKIQGKKGADLVLKLKAKQERVIGSMLIGNNLLNIISSAIATFLAVELWGSIGVFVSTIFTTIIILIFAEILPKTYALNHPENMAITFSRIISLLFVLLSPLVSAFNCIVNILLKLIDRNNTEKQISPYEAIRNLILMHKKKESKTIIQKNLEVINNILDTTEISVDKIMTHRKEVFTINSELSEKEIVNVALANDYNHIPLWIENQENYVHILNVERMQHDFKRGKRINLENYKEKPMFIPETTLVGVQLHNFKVYNNDFAVVIDEYGNVQGIITITDILHEMIGNSASVYTEDFKEISRNCYIVSGKTPILDVNRRLHAKLPTYNRTLAGMLIDEIEYIPEEGETFFLYGHTFTILKQEDNTLISIKVEKRRKLKDF